MGSTSPPVGFASFALATGLQLPFLAYNSLVEFAVLRTAQRHHTINMTVALQTKLHIPTIFSGNRGPLVVHIACPVSTATVAARPPHSRDSQSMYVGYCIAGHSGCSILACTAERVPAFRFALELNEEDNGLFSPLRAILFFTRGSNLQKYTC